MQKKYTQLTQFNEGILEHKVGFLSFICLLRHLKTGKVWSTDFIFKKLLKIFFKCYWCAVFSEKTLKNKKKNYFSFSALLH